MLLQLTCHILLRAALQHLCKCCLADKTEEAHDDQCSLVHEVRCVGTYPGSTGPGTLLEDHVQVHAANMSPGTGMAMLVVPNSRHDVCAWMGGAVVQGPG